MQLETTQIGNTECRERNIHHCELQCTITLGPDQVIATDYGTLVYDNPSVGASRRSSVYAEGAIVFPVKGFLKWGV